MAAADWGPGDYETDGKQEGTGIFGRSESLAPELFFAFFCGGKTGLRACFKNVGDDVRSLYSSPHELSEIRASSRRLLRQNDFHTGSDKNINYNNYIIIIWQHPNSCPPRSITKLSATLSVSRLLTDMRPVSARFGGADSLVRTGEDRDSNARTRLSALLVRSARPRGEVPGPADCVSPRA